MADSLWGEEFSLPVKPVSQKKLIEKVSKPKSVTIATEKAVKSKSVSIVDKLQMITEEVFRILGVYKEKNKGFNVSSPYFSFVLLYF